MCYKRPGKKVDTVLVCMIQRTKYSVCFLNPNVLRVWFSCCSTWGLVSVDQVVTRQIHRAMMHRVDEVGLHHGIVGMLHRIGCVDYIHLERIKTRNTHVQRHKMLLTDLHFRCSSSIEGTQECFRALLALLLWMRHCYVTWLTNAQSYLDLEVIADVATVQFRADQLEFPVKQSLGVPVLVTDEMQDLLIVGHGVHTWNTQRGACVKKKFNQQSPESVRKALHIRGKQECCGIARL